MNNSPSVRSWYFFLPSRPHRIRRNLNIYNRINSACYILNNAPGYASVINKCSSCENIFKNNDTERKKVSE